MSSFRSALACAVISVSGLLVACTGDDVEYGPPDAAPKTDAAVDATLDAPVAPDASDASVQSHLLLVAIGTKGELAVVAPTGDAGVEGRLTFDGDGLTTNGWLVQTAKDRVTLLDPARPWIAKTSFDVKGDDAFDGGEAYADPIQVVPASPTKAYVLRYNRNKIAVVDPSAVADAGAPTKFVDLGSLLQSDDKDGHVDMSGAVYDPTRKRLYVALANVDVKRFAGFDLECPNTTSTLVAIDTTTDAIVSLGGTGPGGSVVLKGRSVQFGALGGVVLDGALDRVFVVTTGCATKGDAGNVLVGRGIEAVDLKTHTTKLLLDANGLDFPGAFAYESEHSAYVAFGFGAFGKTYRWDPTSSSLGAAFAVAPDTFAFDRTGRRLLGPRTTTTADGGSGPVQVTAVSGADGGATDLLANPFVDPGFYFGNASLVP